jgi:CubicO group peptidase (beta-lactamase class C family)
MTEAIEIHGNCAERFSAIRDAFAKNFEEGREVGASFAATINGEYVVDIWAGYADEACTHPWERDTIVNVYSTTKVMAALCTHMLVDRGQLDLDAPVAQYWPEFAQAGKEKIPVRYLLSHQSGLAGIVEPITAEGLYDWDHVVGLLAAQEPLWEPGKHSGYHSLTFGHLLGEVLRRITGKTMGEFFREEVAEPLGADFHIGLAEEHEPRVGELIPPEEPRPVDQSSKLGRAMSNPGLTAMTSRDRAWRAAEIPAANGHGNARSVARIASALACGGELDGVRLLGIETIEKAIEEQCYGKDLVLQQPIRWGLGWGLTSKEMPIGPNPRTFYWGGWGGSAVVMDLDAKMSFAYVMNKMSSDILGDNRVAGPAIALYSEMISGAST